MSLQNEDGAITESFWEPRNYRRTTKRIEDGYKLSFDIIQMIQDRAEIERNYSSRLKTWSRKWSESLEKGPEYGTMESVWKSFLTEADQLAELHSQIKDVLNDKIIADIRNWQHENYHKKFLSLKESKDMEENFKKVQKPWEKLLAKVSKAKQDYHNSCKAEHTGLIQERNAEKDLKLSPLQVQKVKDRVAKLTDDVEKMSELYEDAIAETTKYSSKYIEEMKEVFENCQEMEAKRLEFFKQIMSSIRDCVNISSKQELTEIYQDFQKNIDQANPKEDLTWWSNNFGADMPMNVPVFEDYPEDYKGLLLAQRSVEKIDESEEKGNIQDKIPSSGSDHIENNPFEEDVKDSVGECSENNGNVVSESNPFETECKSEEKMEETTLKPKQSDITAPNPFEDEDDKLSVIKNEVKIANNISPPNENNPEEKLGENPKLEEDTAKGNPFEEENSK